MSAMPSEESAQPHLNLLFEYPFRIFFLSLAVLAVVVVPVWVMVVTGHWALPTALPGFYWHLHEMLFGFLTAAIAGFLLTAVCVWTSTERMHGVPLMLFWLVWLAGRLLLAFGGDLSFWLVQAVNLLFLPLIMLDAGWRILRSGQKRHSVILVVLGLLWIMQVAFVNTLNINYVDGALVLAMALAGIIGGRITPAFTSGWLRQNGGDPGVVKVSPRTDFATLVSLLLLLAMLVIGWHWGEVLFALTSAVLMLVRLAGWHGWVARSEPLLWILHLSLLWIPVALILMAGHLVFGWAPTAWSHAAGVGVIGSLILGVIARVSLGHTGRPLKLPGGMVLAFIAIQLAAVIRVITALGGLPWSSGVGLSALLWETAFVIFLLRYTLILSSPRADGKTG
ncbi:NnrS family protein [Marinobacter sp. 1Y8]